jgi:hypothetical protein
MWALLIVVSACGSSDRGAVASARPVETFPPPTGYERFDITQRVRLEGFSFLPPSGPNWFVRRTTEGSRTDVLFTKVLRSGPASLPDKAGTILVAAFALPLADPVPVTQRPAALAQLQQREQADVTGRFTSVDFRTDIRSNPAQHCYGVEGVVEDRGVPQFQGSVFLFMRQGFKCFHPSRALLLGIEYSQRVPKGQPFLAVETEVSRVLTSIEFDP